MELIPNKVFGIGLSKTGTSSLDRALNQLGIRSIHFASDRTTYAELSKGNYRLSILRQFQAATDISVAPFYAQLDSDFPDSKFILTVRSLDTWLESTELHWDFMWRWAEHDRRFCEFLKFITAAAYGCHRYERERFIYVYERHLQNVRDYFFLRPNDLLILDVCAGEGWERLCPFLGLSIPSQEFPFVNRREEKARPVDWIQQLEQALGEFHATVPPGERYLLIDDQHLAGSELDVPSCACRPMERQGQYFGPPVNATHAIAEIERLHGEGIDYLVIAWPCFWWLDHYGELERHLRRFRTLLENERLRVIDMSTAAAN